MRRETARRGKHESLSMDIVARCRSHLRGGDERAELVRSRGREGLRHRHAERDRVREESGRQRTRPGRDRRRSDEGGVLHHPRALRARRHVAAALASRRSARDGDLRHLVGRQRLDRSIRTAPRRSAPAATCCIRPAKCTSTAPRTSRRSSRSREWDRRRRFRSRANAFQQGLFDDEAEWARFARAGGRQRLAASPFVLDGRRRRRRADVHDRRVQRRPMFPRR